MIAPLAPLLTYGLIVAALLIVAAEIVRRGERSLRTDGQSYGRAGTAAGTARTPAYGRRAGVARRPAGTERTPGEVVEALPADVCAPWRDPC